MFERKTECWSYDCALSLLRNSYQPASGNPTKGAAWVEEKINDPFHVLAHLLSNNSLTS